MKINRNSFLSSERMWPANFGGISRMLSMIKRPNKFIRVPWGLFSVILILIAFQYTKYFLKLGRKRKKECEHIELHKVYHSVRNEVRF
jgi:hypothetical protein